MAQGAAAVAFDVLLAEPDRASPRALARRFRAAAPEVAAGLARLPDTDAALAAALARAPSVTAVAGVGAAAPAPAFPAPPVVLTTPPGVAPGAVRLERFAGLSANLPAFDAAALARGAISLRPDPDGAIRTAPLIQRIGGRLYPLLGVEATRVALGAAFVEATVGAGGAGRLTIAGPGGAAAAALGPAGRARPRFARYDPARYVPAADIVAGRAPPGALTGRIVLVGAVAAGLEDRKLFPANAAPLPGVELHLQVIEALIEGAFLRRPAWATAVEAAAFALAALAFAALALRRRAGAALAVLGATLTLSGAGAVALFHVAGLALDAATPAVALAGFALPMLGVTLIEANLLRRRAEAALARARLAQARIEGELDAARAIQSGLLPTGPLALPACGVTLAGCMVPAAQVGGDFFDYFALPDGRVFFAIGDVSDKGVAASLFMALSKSLLKSVVLRDGAADLGAAQAAANVEILRDNREDMFFTGLAGVLDPASLTVTLSAAGHDMPFLRRADGTVTQLAGAAGLPMGVIAGAAYPTLGLRLGRGDTLLAFTDGLTEARDPAGALFGLERARAAFAAAPAGAEAAVACLRARLLAWEAGAPPADDMTLLALSVDGAGAPRGV